MDTKVSGVVCLVLPVLFLVSGCQAPTQADLIAQARGKLAALEDERQLAAACHRRSMQRLRAFRACLPLQPPQQEACEAAFRAALSYLKPLDCQRYDERRAARATAFRKAGDICLALHPDTTPTQMEEFSACMEDQGW